MYVTVYLPSLVSSTVADTPAPRVWARRPAIRAESAPLAPEPLGGGSSSASTFSPPSAQSLPEESLATRVKVLTSPASPTRAAQPVLWALCAAAQPTTDEDACALPGTTTVVYGDPKMGSWL